MLSSLWCRLFHEWRYRTVFLEPSVLEDTHHAACVTCGAAYRKIAREAPLHSQWFWQCVKADAVSESE